MPSFFDKLRGKQGSGGSGGSKLKSSSMGSLYKDYGGGNIGSADNERSVDGGGGGYDREELNRSSAMASSFPQSSTSLSPQKSEEKLLSF